MSDNNIWMVKASGNEPQPCGPYNAKFVKVEAFDKPESNVVNKWRWEWEISSGAHKGKIASALTDQVITTANHPGRLIAGMAGRPLVANEDLQELIGGFVGQSFMLRQAAGPKGGKPSVQSVDLPPE